MSLPRILHYPGSKWSMADWIISHMPPHTAYLEPFFGSGAVLFSKARSELETVNDIDGEVVNLFRVIRDRPEELIQKVALTPFSREEFIKSHESDNDEVERARRFLVRCWQGRGGKRSGTTGWRLMIEKNGPLPVLDWSKFPNKISSIAQRLIGVQIEQMKANDLIKKHNRPTVCIYADPPYLLSTRTTSAYAHEMTDKDHIQLLDALDEHIGPVLLSGYANELYDDKLQHWTRETREVLAEAGAIRTEVLWINPVAAEYSRQLTLF